MGTLFAFAFVAHSDRDGGQGYWYRCITLRRTADGGYVSHQSDLSPELARRLAVALCDRHNVEDRAGLFCGAIMHAKGGAA